MPSLVPDDPAPDDTRPRRRRPPDDGQRRPPPTSRPASDRPATTATVADRTGRRRRPTAGGARRSATLTELLPIGSPATRGSVLYRADDEPIVALLAATPLFRDLTTGVDGRRRAGARGEPRRRSATGGLDVDEDFDAATAAAVKDWEEDLGRERARRRGDRRRGRSSSTSPPPCSAHEVAVGDLLEPGDAVLVLGAESRVVETDVAGRGAADWPVGTEVSLDWGDGTTGTGPSPRCPATSSTARSRSS